MGRRILLLTFVVGALFAVGGVSSATAKDGEKLPGTLTVNGDIIPLACNAVIEGNVATITCHNKGGPNPHPPKDTKVLKLRENGENLIVTLYPDGSVVVLIHIKASKFGSLFPA
jgi:hypothetical protein